MHNPCSAVSSAFPSLLPDVRTPALPFDQGSAEGAVVKVIEARDRPFSLIFRSTIHNRLLSHTVLKTIAAGLLRQSFFTFFELFRTLMLPFDSSTLLLIPHQDLLPVRSGVCMVEKKRKQPRFSDWFWTMERGSLRAPFSLLNSAVSDFDCWLRGRDLNSRPLGYEPNELPDCSTPR